MRQVASRLPARRGHPGMGPDLRALFINDVGFQYGAGMAHLRQIQSLLLLGHEVAAFCWKQGTRGAARGVRPPAPAGWRGCRSS